MRGSPESNHNNVGLRILEPSTSSRSTPDAPRKRRRIRSAALLVATSITTGATIGITAGVGSTTLYEKVAGVSVLSDGSHTPENYGRIVLDRGKTYTIEAAGDSLANGKGGEKTADGQPKSFTFSLVQAINEISQGEAVQGHTPGLAVDGSSAAALNGRLNRLMEPLSQNRDIVIFVSAENNDVDSFLVDSAHVKSKSPIKRVLNIFKTLKAHRNTYRNSLEDLNNTFDQIQRERKRVLGESSLQVVYVGLPDIGQTPLGQNIFKKGLITPGIAAFIQRSFNSDTLHAAKNGNRNNSGDGNRKKSGVRYAYVNTFSEKADPTDISGDGFHPNANGYRRLAGAMGEVIFLEIGNNIFALPEIPSKENPEK